MGSRVPIKVNEHSLEGLKRSSASPGPLACGQPRCQPWAQNGVWQRGQAKLWICYVGNSTIKQPFWGLFIQQWWFWGWFMGFTKLGTIHANFQVMNISYRDTCHKLLAFLVVPWTDATYLLSRIESFSTVLWFSTGSIKSSIREQRDMVELSNWYSMVWQTYLNMAT